MAIPVVRSVLWCQIFLLLQNSYLMTESSTVGLIFKDEPTREQLLINTTIERKSANREIIFSTDIRVAPDHDCYETSEIMCRMMRSGSGVAAFFGPKSSPSTTILESIASKFHIPYIVTSWRSPFSKPSEFLVDFFPEADSFAHGLGDIVRSFGWKSSVIIYEEDDALIRLKDVLNLQKFNEKDKTNKVLLEKLGNGPDYRSTLARIERSTFTNIILDCRTHKIMSILYQAQNVSMLNAYNNYFITNLDAHTLDFTELKTTANITTIRIIEDNNELLKDYVHRMGLGDLLPHRKLETELALFYDAFCFLNDSLTEMGPSMMTNRISCSDSQVSVKGRTLIEYMKRRQLSSPTLTGPLSFDNFGNRNNFTIHVVDILHDEKIATWYSSNKSLGVNQEFDESLTAVSKLQGTKLTVISRLAKPYLVMKGYTDEGNARYEGYSMDLIASIAKIIGFQYEIVLTDKHGNWDEVNERWTGMIGAILEKRAHLGVGDLTITPERQEVIDFSLPFMSLGISILHKKQNVGNPDSFAFLAPFSTDVWMYLLYTFLFISVVHYFILRLSADDWENTNPCDEYDGAQENNWTMKNTVWHVLRSLTAQSGDKAPKGLSARIATSVWWFFCLVITSMYIANLSIFITQANVDTSINSVEDLAKQSKVKYGVLKGGSTESFFQNSNFSTYQRIWSSMEQDKSLFVKSNSEGVQRVSLTKNGRYAFFLESSQLEYELKRRCDLKQVGDLLDSKSYGIAMPMNSPYRSIINKAILKMQESGQLADLKKKWWEVDDEEIPCEHNDGNDSNGYELYLENVAGLYAVLGVGILSSLIMALIEFLWNVRKNANREDMYFSDVLMNELKFASYVCTTRRKGRTSPVE
ncbi:hypothetical protein JTB14_030749 [Gonioctena quinquepunctata]|nr:hypothetical protein JTB14_030749 [Gonioctena quinquepunctata]